jgi:hypothetical protein
MASLVALRYAVRDRQATLSGLRQDRILDEAEAVGIPDPLHVAAIFGLNADTAQRYVDAFYGRADSSAPSRGHTGGEPAQSEVWLDSRQDHFPILGWVRHALRSSRTGVAAAPAALIITRSGVLSQR